MDNGAAIPYMHCGSWVYENPVYQGTFVSIPRDGSVPELPDRHSDSHMEVYVRCEVDPALKWALSSSFERSRGT